MIRRAKITLDHWHNTHLGMTNAPYATVRRLQLHAKLINGSLPAVRVTFTDVINSEGLVRNPTVVISTRNRFVSPRNLTRDSVDRFNPICVVINRYVRRWVRLKESAEICTQVWIELCKWSMFVLRNDDLVVQLSRIGFGLKLSWILCH